MLRPKPGALNFLTVIGILTLTGHLAFRSYSPLGQHIPEFLEIYAALCLLSAATALWLKANTPTLKSMPLRQRAALPWLVLGFAALYRLILIWGPPAFSTDIYRYIWDGRVQLAGINPYIHPPDSKELAYFRESWHALINHPDLSTIYPPLAQWAFRLAAAVSPTVLTQKAVFTFFDLLTVWVLMRFLILRGSSPAWAVLYAWHPLPVVEFAGSGHLDPLMMFTLVLGLYLAERGRLVAGCAALGLSVMSKITPLVMIPWVLAQKRWSAALAYFGVMAVCMAPFAPDLWQTYRHGLPLFTGIRAYSSQWLANPSIFGLAAIIIPDPAARRISFALLLALLSVPWAVMNRSRPTAYALGCLFAVLLCSPVVQPWYVLWLLPLLCLHRLWSGLAWTWLVGFLYLILHKKLGTLVWVHPLWAWFWLLQYGVVYGLLAREISAMACVTLWRIRLLSFRERP